MKVALIAWVAGAMLRWVLPETQHEAERARYEQIASDAVEVAFDPAEPPIFAGPGGRVRTAVLMLSIASYESAFAKDVEEGKRRGDMGASWCHMQINLGVGRIVLEGDEWRWPTKPDEGFSGSDLVRDRQLCFRVGLHMMRHSYKRCRNLSIYTSGKCQQDEPKAGARMKRSIDMLKKYPAPGVDDDFIAKTLAVLP